MIRTGRTPFLFFLIVGLSGSVRAETINLGALSYDTFIAASNGSPGIFAFDLANLTGADSLPPDFPVSDLDHLVRSENLRPHRGRQQCA